MILKTKSGHIAPHVHLNGTSKKELCDQNLETIQKINKAVSALQMMHPNARDYYTQDQDAYNIASRQHKDRIERLTSVLAELQEIAEHLIDQK